MVQLRNEGAFEVKDTRLWVNAGAPRSDCLIEQRTIPCLNQNEPTTHTWDRQSGKTAHAQQYYAFCVYWKLGAGRSIQKARLRTLKRVGAPSLRSIVKIGGLASLSAEHL
jgi:hypothetical protein